MAGKGTSPLRWVTPCKPLIGKRFAKCIDANKPLLSCHLCQAHISTDGIAGGLELPLTIRRGNAIRAGRFNQQSEEKINDN